MRGVWPPHSFAFTACDFYLSGSLKDKVYGTNFCTLHSGRTKKQHLHDISAISVEELQRVNTIMFRSYAECIWSGGQHFLHLL
jgi:hypothetical protein